jgi:hypothetical protein
MVADSRWAEHLEQPMSFQHTIWQEKPRLTTAAHLAIVSGLLETWRRCAARHTTPEEPDFVAGLVLDATPTLWKLFKEILERHQVSLSLFSVYCHQAPRVRYSGITKSYTEVGDLLLVHAHRKRSGASLRNALLYQAKMSSRQPYHVPKAEQHQLNLYTEWPEFEYFNSPPLSGQRRAVTPSAPHMGAQYLLIDDRPPSDSRSGLKLSAGTYPIGCCMADPYLHDHNDLASEVVDFLVGRSGRHFAGEPQKPAPDGWSQLIWDLILVSLGKAFNRRRSGWQNVPRGLYPEAEALDGASLAVSTVRGLLGNEGVNLLFAPGQDSPPDRAQAQGEAPFETGISMILLETATEGEEERRE